MKLTPKQENFCQKYIELENASDAYRAAYNSDKMKSTTINRNAKAMMDDNKISTRIAELNERAVKRHDITIDNLTTELIADRKLARDCEQASPAITATMSIAKLHGLDVNKTELSGNINVNFNTTYED